MLDRINAIVAKYREEGYTLTLRQLYYQLVSRDIIPNQDAEYKKLSRVLGEGRMAGIVDWNSIEDRLRQVRTVSTWEDPRDILNAAANQFKYDRLQDQQHYVEVWVEKDALSQVVTRAAQAYQIPVLVNRGYGSISSMYDAWVRIDGELADKETATILYLGDHDPSGLDMVRDIYERIQFFFANDDDAGEYWMPERFQVKHIALTREQIDFYNPPPNPAKITDSRAAEYIAEHGRVSWEVDALEPAVLSDLIKRHIEDIIDTDSFEEWKAREELIRDKMTIFIKTFKP